ncbi:hypothetical protein K435DRAFT_974620 [Dendrothele bispora CBS 962.96]|uniref:Uncharacterized protein n=1 Tax=Dendrothele bispora (strain CBS 962.96) TaxID=1314807 RepID=A0A4S8KKQ7_DENBC|nr:hypothetical protein K435DRAFT_974620 [Dendrothele bispora CBS 962.96]
MLLLYALARPLVPSLLASTNNESLPSPEASLEAQNSCFDIRSCRTVEEILYSCLAVVFACTWVAIHPNIPRQFDTDEEGDVTEVADSFTISSARVFAQDVMTMILSLLAPELIILWALRQWFAARKIAKKYSNYGWTRTHGHFLIMGGFALFEDGKYKYTLEDSDEFRSLSRSGVQIEEPNIRRQIESQNSQGEKTKQPSQEGRPEDYNLPSQDPPHPDDGTQGADAPQSESTPLSEPSGEPSPEATEDYHSQAGDPPDPDDSTQGADAESVPLAKPSGKPSPEAKCLLELLIQHKYIDITKDEITAKSKADFLTKFIAVGQTTWFILQCIARRTEGLVITDLEIVTLAFALLNIATYVLWWNKPQRVRYPVKIDYCRSHAKSEVNVKEDKSIKRRVEDGWESFTGWIDDFSIIGRLFVFLIVLPLSPITLSLSLISIYGFNLSSGKGSYQTGLKSDPFSLYPTVSSLFLVFSGIHCTPWNSTFPTHTEQILWRVSAVTVTAFPLVWFPLFGVNPTHHHTSEAVQNLIAWLIIIIILFLLPLAYIWARITLIVIAFMELRALPPSAYQTVDWARFIPHI